MITLRKSVSLLPVLAICLSCPGLMAETNKPVKVFVIAGDENCLEQATISARTDGTQVSFFTDVTPIKDEKVKHVNCAVYKGAYVASTDYEKLAPEVTGVVEVGEQRTERRPDKQKGRIPVEMTPFPELSRQDGYTTVLRGALAVPISGRHEVLPSGFNVTLVEGKEVYRQEPGQSTPTITPIQLDANKRYAFTTVFFKAPEHGFRVPIINRPGALETVVAENPKYACLKDASGAWVTRDDVVLYDAQPMHNNTRTPGHPLQVGDIAYGGQKVFNAVGPELMLGHVLGDCVEEPVFLLRFATRHYIWFMRGSRSLGHDYQPPSSGGDPDLKGSWDVIHFNWGVWDAGYKDVTSKYYQGHGNTTSVADYENNLRTLVARMKQTGATLIWASVTPVWKGEPDKPNGDVVAYNAVAEKVMKENGVIIDDLNSLVPKGTGSWVDPNVHAVGNLAPKVTETILAALASRKEKTKPLPRVLMIGDSITGSYLEKVTQNLDGKAVVYKNSGNAESTWTGLKKIDEWLDLKQYLQNGQEYLELVNGVNDVLAHPDRFIPGYQNQGVELAGLTWFQGIADSQSPAQTAVYEKNLASLIRDLRKDLKAPQLPVVVAAVAFGDGKIHDAQMAVGDPAKYPEFTGNVKSIDTRMFVPSPGQVGSCYNENAGTFLEIGDALGRAMLELMIWGKE